LRGNVTDDVADLRPANGQETRQGRPRQPRFCGNGSTGLPRDSRVTFAEFTHDLSGNRGAFRPLAPASLAAAK
jgi:hypothetical protein